VDAKDSIRSFVVLEKIGANTIKSVLFGGIEPRLGVHVWHLISSHIIHQFSLFFVRWPRQLAVLSTRVRRRSLPRHSAKGTRSYLALKDSC
jgi:hypothetical protein